MQFIKPKLAVILAFSFILTACTSITDKKVALSIKPETLNTCDSVPDLLNNATYTATLSCKWN